MSYVQNETQINSVPVKQEHQPIVFIQNGEVFANSRDVAEYFGKQHQHILRNIDNILKNKGRPKLDDLFIERFEYHEAAQKEVRFFDMTKDGFTLLAMGFTGQKAMDFKIAYIEQFNAMEAELRRQSNVMIDYSDPAILIGVMNHLQVENKKKDLVIAEQGTRLKKLDRLEGADGSMCVTYAAKTLKIKPDHLIKFMSSRHWVYKRPGCKNWIAYGDKIKSGYMEHDDYVYTDKQGRERVSPRALVTAKGLVKLAELLEQPLH